MIVLGIDPGTITTGYGIVEQNGNSLRHVDNGGISPDANAPLSKKLHHIFEKLNVLINAHKPDVVVIENLFVAKNARSSLLLGHARGVAMLAASAAGVEVAEYTPLEVKKAVVGQGHATKRQVQQMVKMVLNLPEVAFEDASDAMAAAICHCQTAGLKKRIASCIASS